MKYSPSICNKRKRRRRRRRRRSSQYILIVLLLTPQETFYRSFPGPGVPADPQLFLSFSLLKRVHIIKEVQYFCFQIYFKTYANDNLDADLRPLLVRGRRWRLPRASAGLLRADRCAGGRQGDEEGRAVVVGQGGGKGRKGEDVFITIPWLRLSFLSHLVTDIIALLNKNFE